MNAEEGGGDEEEEEERKEEEEEIFSKQISQGVHSENFTASSQLSWQSQTSL